MYRRVKIVRGTSGWGGPLILNPDEKRNKILCVTGGGVNPIAVKIAEMTNTQIVDGFQTTVPDEEIVAVVIDCGGTARCGVYPKKKILTINVMPVGKVGPLAMFIQEDLYVSDVKEDCITYIQDEKDNEKLPNAKDSTQNQTKEKTQSINGVQYTTSKKRIGILSVGIGVSKVVNKFYAAGRESINMVIKNILPFMAFTSTILGIISATGLGEIIANTLSPLCATLPGMIVISFICSLPFLSPILGPGAVIAQVIGALLGVEIGLGHIPVQFALPALFAINAQVGADFIPVGLSLGEAEPETIEFGVPAVLYSRLITGPLAVIIAFIFSIGMY